MKCPQGHSLPNVVGNVRCSADYCAEVSAEAFVPGQEITPPAKREKVKAALPVPKRAVNKALKEARAEFGDLGAESQEIARDEQLEKMSRAIGKYEARKAYLKQPDTAAMTAEEAKNYVQQKLDALTPEAIARIEFNLKLGDDQAADRAAYEILDRTGFGKKDGGTPGGAPIIIVQQNAPDGTMTQYRPSFLTVDGKKGEGK